ncbi:hypothetical protein BD560DRAFT_486886 [Blakeslea trispora]|nr:hypothetical protein BD560DRAFT_486886 [Blakeslea trispora]
MPDLKQLQKDFVNNEKEPYLMIFIHEYINEIKQAEEDIEKLQKVLVTRHQSFLNIDRPDAKENNYAHLDIPVFRALLRKRKREHDDADATSSFVADDMSIVSSLFTETTSSTVALDRQSLPPSALSASTSDELVNSLRSIRATAYGSRQQEEKLNAVQNLCLNHIYFVSTRRSKSVGKYLTFDQHACLLSLESVVLPRVDSSVNTLVKKLEQATMNMGVRYTDAVDEMEIIAAKGILELDRQSKPYASALIYAIPNIHQWCKEGLGETLFIESHFTPMVASTLCKLDQNVFCYDKYAFAFRQDKQANCNVLKPDFTLSVCTAKGEKLDIYQMEAKTPEANKGNKDFIKLANNMKVMVDELVSRGCPLEAACSYGTLIHGNRIMNYKLALYKDGIYLLREMSVGRLPEAYDDISSLVKNMQTMMLFKEEIEAKASLLEGLSCTKTIHPFQRETSWRIRGTRHWLFRTNASL